jgi:hypothetical protein
LGAFPRIPHWSGEWIAAIARNPKVARYVDMPLQHIDGACLLQCAETLEHIEDLIFGFDPHSGGCHPDDLHRWISRGNRGTFFVFARFY